jgi:hypothetical protein
MQVTLSSVRVHAGNVCVCIRIKHCSRNVVSQCDICTRFHICIYSCNACVCVWSFVTHMILSCSYKGLVGIHTCVTNMILSCRYKGLVGMLFRPIKKGTWTVWWPSNVHNGDYEPFFIPSSLEYVHPIPDHILPPRHTYVIGTFQCILTGIHVC